MTSLTYFQALLNFITWRQTKFCLLASKVGRVSRLRWLTFVSFISLVERGNDVWCLNNIYPPYPLCPCFPIYFKWRTMKHSNNLLRTLSSYISINIYLKPQFLINMVYRKCLLSSFSKNLADHNRCADRTLKNFALGPRPFPSELKFPQSRLPSNFLACLMHNYLLCFWLPQIKVESY